MKFLKKIINLIPYLLISYIASGVGLLTLISIFKFNNSWESFLSLVHLLFFSISLLCFKSVRKVFFVDDFKKYNWILLILGLILILYRFPIYFHALDDYVWHMIGGYYALDIWSNNDFLPATSSSYLYPLLQVCFYQLINLIGIRLTVLILSLSQLFWFLSLNYRFGVFFNKKNKSSFFYVNLFFIFLYFLPELVLTHTLFMSDFYTVLFALEIIYFFLSKNKNFDFVVILMMLGILTKQSSGFFLVPIFLYFIFTNIKKISKKQWIVIFAVVGLILIYCIRTYLDTGNPLASLFNGVFKSPLYPNINARDLRWGPVGLKEILTWPLFAYFNPKYIESLVLHKFSRYFWSLYLIILYIMSLFLFFKKRKIKYLIMFLSILFWSWQSGYGRYQISMNAIIWILLIQDLMYVLPNHINNKIKIIIYVCLCGLSILNIKNDYAIRSFIMERYWPPKINEYYKNKYIEGLNLLGKDRYIDIYNSIKDKFDNFNGIVVVNKGGSNFYSFLAAKYKNIPVYLSISNENKNKILLSDKVSKNIKQNLIDEEKNVPLLLISDLDLEGELKKTDIYNEMDCIRLNRDKLAPQFQHSNYFNNVAEYDCR